MSFWLDLSNLLKVGALKLSDVVNPIVDPFDEFARKIEPRYPEPLHLKAEKFEKDMVTNFRLFEGKIWNYNRHENNWVDTGDQCIWQGVYTAMWALEYAVTKSEIVRNRLSRSVDGLSLHQTIHGEPNRRIIRGFRLLTPEEKLNPPSFDNEHQKFIINGNYLIEDSPSNDSGAGHILGIYMAWKYGDKEIRDKVALLARGFADELIAHDFKIVLADGTPTKFGKLINGVLTDPLGLSLCLCILKTAFVVTGEQKYQDHYQHVESKYNKYGLVRFAKARFISWQKHPDNHRAIFLLSILAEMETDKKLKEEYLCGVKRVWKVVHKTMNVWVAYWYANHHTLTDKEKVDLKGILQEFSFEDKSLVVEKVNSLDAKAWESKGVKMFRWEKGTRSSQPLPRWMVGSQDFFWQRNMNSVDDWIGTKHASMFHNGGDFLAAYWLGRKLGLLTKTD